MKRLNTIAFASILGGACLHLAVFTVIRIQGPAERPQFSPPAEVLFIGSLNEALVPDFLQQAALFDSAPLFMPTRWNLVSEMSDVASLRGATEIFQPFPAQLKLPGTLPPRPESGRDAPVSVIPQLPDGPAFALSRLGLDRSPLPSVLSWGPSIRVDRLDSAATGVASLPSLPEDIRGVSPAALWDPVQFHFHLVDGVPVGLPLLVGGSGFPDWDNALQGYISSLGFYRRLGDGYYRLWVFP